MDRLLTPRAAGLSQTLLLTGLHHRFQVIERAGRDILPCV